MKITCLELENWMGIPRLALDLGAGINLLYGRNEIGKSSIIHSIRQALIGDASSTKAEYKMLKPWGVDVNAKVRLSFACKDNKQYRICKSFPNGGAELYQGDILLSDETKKTREKLFKILEISEKTTNLFHLLFIDQGDTLSIFKKKSKENPLDENTKSYIKEIIKETAFKEIQEFQDHLQAELDRYLTPGRDKVRKNTPYFELQEKEKVLSGEIEDLRQKEQEITDKLDAIEKAGKEIAGLEEKINQREKYLETLQKKKTRLLEMEKKALDFKLVQNEYNEYIKITGEQEELRQRLPLLLAGRQQRIADLKKELLQVETGKKQSLERLEQLKQKKQAGEKLEANKREFTDLKRDYDEVRKLEKQSSEIQAELPSLLAQHRSQLQEELQNLTKKIQGRTQLETEKAGIETKIKDMPKITPGGIDSLRKQEKENEKLQTRIDSAREKLKLSFRLTPMAGKEIPYRLAKDGGEPDRGTVNQPLEISGFHRLDFTYENHLDLQVKGNLTETDIAELQEKLLQNRQRMQEKLAAFGVEDIGALEQRHRQYTELETRLKYLHEQLQSTGETTKLEEQQRAILDNLGKVDQDMQKYSKDKTGEAKARGTIPGIRDRLTAAKTKLDSYRQAIDRVLAGRRCTFAQLESLYKKQETELSRREEQYRDLEPKAVVLVDQANLDKENAQSNEIEKTMGLKQSQLELLETMELIGSLSEAQETPGPQGRVSLFTGYSSQQLRDDIHQSIISSRDLDRRKQDLLGETNDQDFKMNYFRRKDEIETIKKDLEAVPPVEFNDLEKIDVEIETAGKEIKATALEKGEIEKQRERLSGETADFSRVMEEKTNKEVDYRQVLEEIRAGIVELSSLRLLNRLIEEERDRAQQEVFRPLQDRVHRSFTALVGERYRVGIDNDLNLEISGRTGSGEYQAGVEEVLSFGTREQLSFLFRLAIAAQLSRKEPAVMVLDDSFVNTDLHRLPLLLDLIMKRDAEMQFLVFTCRPGDYLSYLSRTEEEEKYLRSINLEEIMKIG
jgi:DNA repair exonuclease SbcCD ATPase subunit